VQSLLILSLALAAPAFHGRYIDGVGDRAYLQALDEAYAMTQPDAKTACLPLLYARDWNGFVEGPTWNAWWIQNSFGPSYTMMPFLSEPYQTWLTNSQGLWYALMGDGKRRGGDGGIGPVGCLCDCATTNWVMYKQGDGQVGIHDWCIGFTAAGLILESELMLIKRDKAEIARMLPRLEAVAGFLDSRRDPKTNLLLGGIASNLLAPSFGGWLKADGTRDKAYLAELSVNYVAGLDRLIEVCKLAGKPDRAKIYAVRRDLVKKALPKLMTSQGYFLQALAPDGSRYGEFGAPVHGYFETAPNHDAMCFRVVDDRIAARIYENIRNIPELRPHDLILPNYPGYDSMYENDGIFQYGIWVNGGHWTTAEARMIMGYYRVGAQADALRAFAKIRALAKAFRADNNLTDRGAKLYQPAQPYNVVYDCWGAPGGMLRGLFEYVYTSRGLRLYPHLPAGVSKLVQRFPVLFGRKRLFLSAAGVGPLTGVLVDGKPVSGFDGKSVLLMLSDRPGNVHVQLLLGGAKAFPAATAQAPLALHDLSPELRKYEQFREALTRDGLGDGYAAQQALMILRMAEAAHERHRLTQSGAFATPPPEIPSAKLGTVDQLYDQVVQKLIGGLGDYLKAAASRPDGRSTKEVAAASFCGLLREGFQ
jgi:hypothetical protein